MTQSIPLLHKWNTTYSVRNMNNEHTIKLPDGTKKHVAQAYAQGCADAHGTAYCVIEHDSGLCDYFTWLYPN